MIRCEKCGEVLRTLEVNFFDYEGYDVWEPVWYEEQEIDAVTIDVPPSWTGDELDEEELADTIRCPYCGKYPFKSTEIQTYRIDRVVMFKEAEEETCTKNL